MNIYYSNDDIITSQIDSKINAKIVEYEKLGLKPESIIKNLINAGFQLKKKTKLNNILKAIRKSKKVTNQRTMNDIKYWCEQYNEMAESDFYQFFVAEYEFHDRRHKKYLFDQV